MLNPSTNIDNYLLRHSSANTSLNESTSLEPFIDNHDDIFSMIEQAGITFDAFTGSSTNDLLASTSGYHSYEPSPFNQRTKRSSLLDPSAAEFHMENEPIVNTNHRSSYQSDQSIRRSSSSSRSQNHTPSRIPTSCKKNFFLFFFCRK